MRYKLRTLLILLAILPPLLWIGWLWSYSQWLEMRKREELKKIRYDDWSAPVVVDPFAYSRKKSPSESAGAGLNG